MMSYKKQLILLSIVGVFTQTITCIASGYKSSSKGNSMANSGMSQIISFCNVNPALCSQLMREKLKQRRELDDNTVLAEYNQNEELEPLKHEYTRRYGDLVTDQDRGFPHKQVFYNHNKRGASQSTEQQSQPLREQSRLQEQSQPLRHRSLYKTNTKLETESSKQWKNNYLSNNKENKNEERDFLDFMKKMTL